MNDCKNLNLTKTFTDSPAAKRAPNNCLRFENNNNEGTMLIAYENVARAITEIEINNEYKSQVGSGSLYRIPSLLMPYTKHPIRIVIIIISTLKFEFEFNFRNVFFFDRMKWCP